MNDDKALLKRLGDFLGRVDAVIGVDRAFLFGSTAKGNRLVESDVDLIVVSKSFAGVPVPERLGLLQKEWDYPEELQALAYTPEEFNEISKRLTMKEILAYAVDLTGLIATFEPFRPRSRAD